MKKFILMLFFYSITLYKFLFAQILPANVNPAPLNKPANFDQLITLTRQDGRPFQGDIADAEGSPYYFDSFTLANLTLEGGKDYDSVFIKLDIVNNELHCLSPGPNKQIILKDGLVREFVFTEKNKEISGEKFRCGFPSVDKNTINSYYKILSDGKLQLLKFSKKEYRQSKDLISGEIKKEFVQNDFYYVYTNDNILKLKKDKEWFISLMQDQREKIESWLSDNKINFKNMNNLVRLFDYYNLGIKPN
jgi:hypothetical protein